MQANARHTRQFLKQAGNNNNVLGLAILKSSPKNHSAQTTPRPALSGKSRFRRKGDTIDNTAHKKENRASRLGPLWDAAGCWLTSQRWSLLSSGKTKQPVMQWVQLKQTSPCSAVWLEAASANICTGHCVTIFPKEQTKQVVKYRKLYTQSSPGQAIGIAGPIQRKQEMLMTFVKQTCRSLFLRLLGRERSLVNLPGR